MLTITQRALAEGLRCARNTATSRTCGLDFSIGRAGIRHYRLADVMPVLKDRERAAAPCLFQLAADDGEELFVGDRAIQRARRLESWLRREECERLDEARAAFTIALAASVQTSVLFEHLQALRLKLALTDPVLRWTALGDAEALPSFEHWAVPFAITNARYETLYGKKAA